MGLLFFEWGKIQITRQIKDAWEPFLVGVQCDVHRTNLAI